MPAGRNIIIFNISIDEPIVFGACFLCKKTPTRQEAERINAVQYKLDSAGALIHHAQNQPNG